MVQRDLTAECLNLWEELKMQVEAHRSAAKETAVSLNRAMMRASDPEAQLLVQVEANARLSRELAAPQNILKVQDDAHRRIVEETAASLNLATMRTSDLMAQL